MPFTLAYLDSPVPGIPTAPGSTQAAAGRPADRQEHFGTEDAALRRAAALLPGPDWFDLRLYGPDGRLIAGPDQLSAKLGIAAVQHGSARSGTGEGQTS
jgi:hypothetical protein